MPRLLAHAVGSRHEGYGEIGMAHLIEHMLFLRTKSGKDIKELTDRGADWNGATDWDRTNHFETVTSRPSRYRRPSRRYVDPASLIYVKAGVSQ